MFPLILLELSFQEVSLAMFCCNIRLEVLTVVTSEKSLLGCNNV
jgi:hypothetical protein